MFFENKGAHLFLSSSMTHNKDTECSRFSKLLLGELYELARIRAKSIMLRRHFLQTWLERKKNMFSWCYLGGYLLTCVRERTEPNYNYINYQQLLGTSGRRYKGWFLQIIKIFATIQQKLDKSNHEQHHRNQNVLWMKQKQAEWKLHNPNSRKQLLITQFFRWIKLTMLIKIRQPLLWEHLNSHWVQLSI